MFVFHVALSVMLSQTTQWLQVMLWFLSFHLPILVDLESELGECVNMSAFVSAFVHLCVCVCVNA